MTHFCSCFEVQKEKTDKHTNKRLRAGLTCCAHSDFPNKWTMVVIFLSGKQQCFSFLSHTVLCKEGNFQCLLFSLLQQKNVIKQYHPFHFMVTLTVYKIFMWLTSYVHITTVTISQSQHILLHIYVSLFDVTEPRTWKWGWIAFPQPHSSPRSQNFITTLNNVRRTHLTLAAVGPIPVCTIKMDDGVTALGQLRPRRSQTKQTGAYSSARYENGNEFLLFHLLTEHFCCAKSK